MKSSRISRVMCVGAAGAVISAFACASLGGGKSDESRDAPVAELVEPAPDIEHRNLFYGVGGRENVPPADAPFHFLDRDESGFSSNIEVRDASGRKWDAKLGREAQTEVVASRLLWAAGFYQPPVYFVREWRTADGPEAGVQPPARFRLEQKSWKKGEEWDWGSNPFVGTRELRGLVVLMALINNWDLKTSNNIIYERRAATPEHIYVVKDLGQSFGDSVQLFLGTQNDVSEFREKRLIADVDGDRVKLDYEPVILNWEVDNDIHVEDVLWICRRLARLSDAQWRDAFRAGGYSDDEGAAFIAHLQRKIQEGLALEKHARS